MKRRVVAYVRVSTEEQAKHGFSIEAQTQVLRDYARSNGLTIVEEFVEAESAFKPGRPRFREMLKLLKRRTDLTGVLCYKVDRLARNLMDFAQIAEMAGIEVISATEPQLTGSTGEMIAGIHAVFARHFSRQLGERVSLGMRMKAERGLWPSTAPIGYLNDAQTKGIVVDRISAEKVTELFNAYAGGKHSLADAARLAREIGLRGRRGGELSTSQVYWILTNPIYYGEFVWKGEIFAGTHTPLVSRGLFERVQEILGLRSHDRQGQEFPFRGILTCGYCGCKITAERHDKKTREYIYYRCTNGRGKCLQPYVRQEKLAERLSEVVDRVHLDETLVSELLRALRRDTEERRRQRRERIRKLTAEKTVREKRRDAGYADKLDGKITEERWLRLDREWEGAIAKVEDQLELLRSVTEPRLDEANATFELLERAPSLYSRQDPEEQASLLRTLVSNCFVNEENLVPVYKKPFDLVAEGLRYGDWYALLDNFRTPLGS